jgi:hypothetical protein
MKRLLSAIALLMLASPALAQSSIGTINGSAKITTGLTFQQIYPAVSPPTTIRNALEIENNNTTSTENCWINYDGTVTAGMTTASSVTVNGVSLTAAQASVYLAPLGGSYTRYYPHTPNGIIVGTCTTTGDSIFAATQ